MASFDPSELRPFGLGESLDVAAGVLRNNLGRLVLRATSVVVPLNALRWAHQNADLKPTARAIVEAAGGQNGFVDYAASSRFMATGVMEYQPLVAFGLVVAALVGATLITIRPALAAIVGAERTRPPSFGVMRLLQGALRVAVVILCFGVGVTTVIAPIFGIWLTGRWSFIPAATIGESDRTVNSARARSLADGDEFRIGFRIFIAAVVAVALTACLSLVAMAFFHVGAFNVPRTLVTLSLVLSSITLSVTAAFLGCVIAVTYLEQRTRKEGFDIALMIQSHSDSASGA